MGLHRAAEAGLHRKGDNDRIMFFNYLTRVFGSKNERELKKLQPLLEQVDPPQRRVISQFEQAWRESIRARLDQIE